MCIRDSIHNELRKYIVKLNTPEVKMHNKISVIALMTDIPLTYLFKKQNDIVIEIRFDTSENSVLETGPYKVAETYITRTQIVLHTRVIRMISADEIMDHG